MLHIKYLLACTIGLTLGSCLHCHFLKRDTAVELNWPVLKTETGLMKHEATYRQTFWSFRGGKCRGSEQASPDELFWGEDNQVPAGPQETFNLSFKLCKWRALTTIRIVPRNNFLTYLYSRTHCSLLNVILAYNGLLPLWSLRHHPSLLA